MPTTPRSNLPAIVTIFAGTVILVPVLFAIAGLPDYSLLADGVWDSALWMDGSTPDWLPIPLGGLLVVGVGVCCIGLYLLARGQQGTAVATDPALEELRHGAAPGQHTPEEPTDRSDRRERDS